MRAILNNTVDFILYNLYVRTLNLFGWLSIYKYWIICGITLASVVLAAGETFGWDKLSE